MIRLLAFALGAWVGWAVGRRPRTVAQSARPFTYTDADSWTYTAGTAELLKRQIAEDAEDLGILKEAAKKYAGKDWRKLAKPLQ